MSTTTEKSTDWRNGSVGELRKLYFEKLGKRSGSMKREKMIARLEESMAPARSPRIIWSPEQTLLNRERQASALERTWISSEPEEIGGQPVPGVTGIEGRFCFDLRDETYLASELAQQAFDAAVIEHNKDRISHDLKELDASEFMPSNEGVRGWRNWADKPHLMAPAVAYAAKDLATRLQAAEMDLFLVDGGDLHRELQGEANETQEPSLYRYDESTPVDAFRQVFERILRENPTTTAALLAKVWISKLISIGKASTGVLTEVYQAKKA
jgi:hypothetical protein